VAVIPLGKDSHHSLHDAATIDQIIGLEGKKGLQLHV
jgi:hypothetical protein